MNFWVSTDVMVEPTNTDDANIAASSQNRLPPQRIASADPKRWAQRAPRKGTEASRLLEQLCRRAGRAVTEYDLIREGDRVLCAISGGKDSLSMLEVLLRLQARAPVGFELAAITVQAGFPDFDHQQVTAYCAELGVETWLAQTDIWQTMQTLGGPDATPCAWCARLRRGVLYRLAEQLGFGVLALGHHADDAIETTLMNMLFAGQLRAMAPRTVAKRAPVVVIRPLATSFEAMTRQYAKVRPLPVTDCGCPLGCSMMSTEREAMKRLVNELCADYPQARQSLLASLGNVDIASLYDLRASAAERSDDGTKTD